MYATRVLCNFASCGRYLSPAKMRPFAPFLPEIAISLKFVGNIWTVIHFSYRDHKNIYSGSDNWSLSILFDYFSFIIVLYNFVYYGMHIETQRPQADNIVPMGLFILFYHCVFGNKNTSVINWISHPLLIPSFICQISFLHFDCKPVKLKKKLKCYPNAKRCTFFTDI